MSTTFAINIILSSALFSTLVAAVDFNYEDHGTHWNGTCATGLKQSPIDARSSGFLALPLDPTRPASSRPTLSFGRASNLIVINNGETMQVQWGSSVGNNATIPYSALLGQYNATGSITVGNITVKASDRVPLTPLQFHVHTPSEHLLEGRNYSVEAHLVTQVGAKDAPICAPSGCLAVFGVFFKAVEGAAPSFLDAFIDALPVEVGNVSLPATANLSTAADSQNATLLDFSKFFPQNASFASYAGSLTTPPCTEGVAWNLFATPLTISTSQLHALEGKLDASHTCLKKGGKPCPDFSAQHDNARATQPLNGRTVWAFADNSNSVPALSVTA